MKYEFHVYITLLMLITYLATIKASRFFTGKLKSNRMFSYSLSDAKRSLVFGEQQRQLLYQVDLDAEPQRAAPLPIDGIRGVSAVAFDPVDQQIYYAETYPGIIRRNFLNGTAEETIVSGIYFASRMEIDYIYRNIYFTDILRNRLDVASLDGLYRKFILSEPGLESIALDLTNG